VNAFYSTTNVITLPAGILEPPFFAFDGQRALNFGAISAIIGHEITHGYDDQGSKYDARTNIRDLFTTETRANFTERSQCLIQEAEAFDVGLPGAHMDGKLTLGENIADRCGITAAWRAMHAVRDYPVADTTVAGLNEDQQFYLAWGQAWCVSRTPEKLRSQLATDPHGENRFRVNGHFANSPEFAATFACHPGQRMVAEKICSVW
jgi:putative endopeptidase